VVSTYIAGIPELIRDGREGFLIPSGDASSLCDALERALTMPSADLTALCTQARVRVQERHSVDTEAKKLQALFTEAVRGSGLRGAAF
jgi:colanic acid/amylovoran biosynthesis glycosyltransferase